MNSTDSPLTATVVTLCEFSKIALNEWKLVWRPNYGFECSTFLMTLSMLMGAEASAFVARLFCLISRTDDITDCS